MALRVRVARNQTWLVPIMCGLIGTAWLALLVWDETPYGRYLHHGRWLEIGFTESICSVLPSGEGLLEGALYIGGWLLMTSAMMLPTVLPLLRRFEVMTAGRGDRAGLSALLLGGYLLAWLAFGVAAHGADTALHMAATRSTWLVGNAWTLGAGVLLIAGLFQFSWLKYHCLDQCRTPLSFLVRHWGGIAPRRDAFYLGLHHGLFCVGCCWALMLVMFVVGTGNIAWMLMLGALMGVEKNAHWGRQLGRPLGVILIALAAFVLSAHIA